VGSSVVSKPAALVQTPSQTTLVPLSFQDEEREEGDEDEEGDAMDMSQDVTGLDAKYEDGDDDLDLDEMAQVRSRSRFKPGGLSYG
jgi:hypothetical protein